MGAVLVLGSVLGWFIAAAPSITLGSIKDDYVTAVEQSGIDMTKCKARRKTLLDPSGGMQQCVQEVFTEVQKQVDEIDNYEADSRWNEAPSNDWSSEAAPSDSSAEEPSND
jgi:hypothetical protein